MTHNINIGDKFNSLRVESLIPAKDRKGPSYKWLCRCDCGNSVAARAYALVNNNIKSCGCKNPILAAQKSHDNQRKRSESKIETYINGFRRRAISRGLEFDVDAEYLESLIIKQLYSCALSGLPIDMEYDTKCTASIDRIDSTKGYVVGNVQWVHKTINQMKWDLESEVFAAFCKCVSMKSFTRSYSDARQIIGKIAISNQDDDTAI